MCTLHDTSRALALFPRIVALRAGRVAFDARSAAVSQGTLDELYRGALAATAEAPGGATAGDRLRRATARP